MFSLLGRRIGQDDHTLFMMHNMTAESRLCRFLMIYHKRLMKFYGEEVAEIPLMMTKDDIARYLGICPETLSRVLNRLNKNGVIRNHSKSLELLDRDTLYQMAC